MASPGPNEILHEWSSQNDLLDALSDAPIDPNLRADLRAVASKEHEGPLTVAYTFKLRDANGDPLRYPIRLVSRTQFERDGRIGP